MVVDRFKTNYYISIHKQFIKSQFMSSIYKKGRDGYYYYQTYIYNPESKDKRVFHAQEQKIQLLQNQNGPIGLTIKIKVILIPTQKNSFSILILNQLLPLLSR